MAAIGWLVAVENGTHWANKPNSSGGEGRRHMKRAALLILVTLIGCNNQATVTKDVKTAGQPCTKHDDATWSVAAARAATDRGDYRVYGYGQQGEGYAVLVPGPAEIRLRFYGPDDPRVHEIAIERDLSPREPCVDCDAPLTSCGEQQRQLMARYNSEVCRQASLNGITHCGQAMDSKRRWRQGPKATSDVHS